MFAAGDGAAGAARKRETAGLGKSRAQATAIDEPWWEIVYGMLRAYTVDAYSHTCSNREALGQGKGGQPPQ